MVDYLIVLAWGAAVLIGAHLLEILIVRGRALRARRIRARHARPPEWWITLVVETDPVVALVRAGVELRGDPIPKAAGLRLELVDGRGVKRATASRSLPAGVSNRHFCFDPIVIPYGAEVDEVLNWRWDVVLSSGRRRLERWQKRLIPLQGLNAEGEIA